MISVFRPYEPGSKGQRRRPRARVPIRALIPNMITLLALCAGLTAIRLAIEGRFQEAVLAIFVAAFLDGIDGRVARLLRSATRFGAELDSLTDFVNFGVAPGVVLYVWGLSDLRSVGWIAVLIYAICCALRLARFNVALDDTDRPKWMSNYFVGIPAPAAACTVLLPLYLHFIGTPRLAFVTAGMVIIYMLGVAFLMVSRIPTFSGKLAGQVIDRRWVTPLFMGFVLLLGLLATFPWSVLTLCTIAYFAVIPVSVMRFRHNSKRMMKGAGGRPETDDAAP
ncbi:MAG: CDP-diacylglycerol--serine O-phosphatidyltransferase [Rhodobiaceae bacterium]|nr:CDP-diacylglycerol--serine O-phosphatidyltransferase [Rhodobiaceae bacterium]